MFTVALIMILAIASPEALAKTVITPGRAKVMPAPAERRGDPPQRGDAFPWFNWEGTFQGEIIDFDPKTGKATKHNCPHGAVVKNFRFVRCARKGQAQ